MKPEDDSSRSLPPSWTFFVQWLKNPLRVAAISPSSRQLARQMMTQLPRPCRRVIELGGGTGVFTQALLEHGVAPADLLVLELNEELHQHLVRQFPGRQGRLRRCRKPAGIAKGSGFAGDSRADAIISGLGLLSMPRQTQHSILEAAFDSLHPTDASSSSPTVRPIR